MAKQLLEVRVDIPEGWEWTGEYRRAAKGQGYLFGGKAIVWTSDIGSTQEYFILRRVKPVRESRWGWMCCFYSSREQAIAEGGQYSSPMIRIDYENGAHVHVALEPAEGEG